MKQRKPNPPQYTPKAEREQAAEPTLTFNNCLECKEPIMRGYYGPHEGGGTCCGECERKYTSKPKEYIDDNGIRH